MHRVCLLCLIVFSTTVVAQDQLTEHTLKRVDPNIKVVAALDKFQWLVGAWQGKGFGADCDEMWSAPAGGTMVGTFRLIDDGRLKFSEFFVLLQQDGQTVLRLKHFDDQFVGWEAKDKSIDFPLIKVEGQTAWFDGLTYSLQKDGSLKVWVAMKKKDGSFNEGALHFHRSTTR